MIALGVNIDHIATLRQARGTRYPNPVEAALRAETAGADYITLHLREDRRHIQDRDVLALRELLQTHMNLESAITPAMIAFAKHVKPRDVCLVPEKREELTTEGGLDVVARMERVREVCAELAAAGVRVSLFIDPDRRQIDSAQKVGAPVVEIHTGRYADAPNHSAQEAELATLRAAAAHGRSLGLQVNAGHGLNYHNVQAVAAVPEIAELNIGHAIVSHAVFVGWEAAVREMKSLMLLAR